MPINLDTRPSSEREPAKVQRYKAIEWTSVEGIAVTELWEMFMNDKDIPPDARIQYQGCGSHSIEFTWWEEVN